MFLADSPAEVKKAVWKVWVRPRLGASQPRNEGLWLGETMNQRLMRELSLFPVGGACGVRAVSSDAWNAISVPRYA